MLTNTQREVVEQLRSEGYAVIIWTPDELGNASAKDVQDRSIEHGHEVIESLGGWA